jgi:aldehyde:ferredoxin oxidoreductase
MSKILRVNMTDLTAKFEHVPEKYKLMGGRGLRSKRMVPTSRSIINP